VELTPSGPGRYAATTTLPDEGVYLAQITASDPTGSEPSETETASVPVAGQTTGLVIPYSPEYARLESDVTLLTDLAALTGGRRLDNPAQTFAPTPAIGRQSRPLWPLLLLAAALLFPLDVAVRRVRLGHREWQRAIRWVTARLPGQATEPGSEAAAPTLHSELFEARQRARERYSAPPSTERPPVSSPKAAPASPPTSPPPEKPASLKEKEETEEQDTLARLQAAKRRAKR
ncbi:MAG: hypothetical protein KDJ65_34560, partial [Anaerolineae bacterium]|nr:hypothetical protein [Anaerolineae bacterium]